MSFRLQNLAACAVLLLLGSGQASAEVVRFRYAQDACGNTVLVPVTKGARGERVAWFGASPEPFHRQIRPTHVVAFRHPKSGRVINVPMTFPPGSPRIQYRADRVLYHYTSYKVQARFLADGSVEVIYKSGAARPLNLQ